MLETLRFDPPRVLGRRHRLAPEEVFLREVKEPTRPLGALPMSLPRFALDADLPPMSGAPDRARWNRPFAAGAERAPQGAPCAA